MSSGTSLKGATTMKKNVKRFGPGLLAEVEQALYVETEVEVKEVKRRTPVDEGTLRGTVHQDGPFREGKKVWTRIVVGGPSAPYAIYVHEDLEAVHKVGQAKFLESVILESRPFMAARIAKRISIYRAMAR